MTKEELEVVGKLAAAVERLAGELGRLADTQGLMMDALAQKLAADDNARDQLVAMVACVHKHVAGEDGHGAPKPAN